MFTFHFISLQIFYDMGKILVAGCKGAWHAQRRPLGRNSRHQQLRTWRSCCGLGFKVAAAVRRQGIEMQHCFHVMSKLIDRI